MRNFDLTNFSLRFVDIKQYRIDDQKPINEFDYDNAERKRRYLEHKKRIQKELCRLSLKNKS